jgi:hypothetical protein
MVFDGGWAQKWAQFFVDGTGAEVAVRPSNSVPFSRCHLRLSWTPRTAPSIVGLMPSTCVNARQLPVRIGRLQQGQCTPALIKFVAIGAAFTRRDILCHVGEPLFAATRHRPLLNSVVWFLGIGVEGFLRFWVDSGVVVSLLGYCLDTMAATKPGPPCRCNRRYRAVCRRRFRWGRRGSDLIAD